MNDEPDRRNQHFFRVYYMAADSLPHVYCRIFVGSAEATGAAIGNLTMSKTEFKAFRESFKAAQFIAE